MHLEGINILVDGYNLELQKGTGIKSYGINLIKALISLDINVDVLCSRNLSNINNSILDAALFFDSQTNNIGKKSQIKAVMSAAIQLFSKAHKIPYSDFVIKQEFDSIFDLLNTQNEAGEIFNQVNCYKMANILYRKVNLTTKVNIDKKIDIFHATYPLPIKINRAKKITTIHDIIPLKLPYTTLDDKSFFFKTIKNTIKDSDLILTVSENSKKDILDCFDVDTDKIFVTHQAIVNNSFPILEHDIFKTLNKFKLKYKKYILFVGAIEPKKNIGRLIDAFSGLDTDMQLVIVGKKGWLWEGEIGKLEAIFDTDFSQKVKLLEYLPKQDLAYLYKGAFCFVFPSLYEGFGLPPLEAMTLGCPVITSSTSSLPEVCGDAALYVDPYSSESIRNQIEKLINDSQLQEKLSNAGKERAKLFSIENYIKKLYTAYTKVV
ncbi:MAG: glycosyltransferase family 4 protein [Rivularia sp. (in: cyanobacteria)]